MKKAITQGVLLLVITVIVGTFVNFQQAEYVKTRKEKAELISLSIATQVEEKVNREIYITNLLDVLIRANAEEPFPAFHRAVSDILRVAPSRNAVQLSSDGVFEELAAASDSSMEGRSFYAMPPSPVAAVIPVPGIESGGMVRSVDVKKSGRLVAYHPVYDSAGDFLGFSLVPVNLADLFQKTRSFQEITRDNYCTVAVLADTDTRMIYSNLGEAVALEPVRTEIRLANGTIWAMTLVPKEGWISLGHRWMNGAAAVIVILVLYRVLSNIGKIKRQSVINERMASLDALTNLLNKRAFEQKLGELNGGIEPYGLIFLDLDHFKEINDQHGHDAGDQVLSETAQRMKKAVREVDKVYRVGGDEFVILIAGGLSLQAYEEVRKRLKGDVEGKPVLAGLQPLHVHVSMGYAEHPADGDTACEVLKVADQRMYEDKQQNHRRRASKGMTCTVGG